MRKITILFLLLMIISGISYAISFNRIIYPIKIKDASGAILTQKQPPLRIISADPAVTEVLFALNLKDKIVGVTDDCNRPEEARKIEKIGHDKLNIEKIIKLQPDLILVRLDRHGQDIEKLRKLTIPPITEEALPLSMEVFAVSPSNLSEIIEMISTIGTVTNKEHSAYSLIQRMKRRIEWVTARAMKEKRMKAIYLLKKRPIVVAGQDSWQHDMLVAAGFTDVAPRSDASSKMNRKDIEKADPDIIITSTDVARNPKDIYNNRNFRKTSAGKNKRVICVDAEMMSRPGPRIVQVLDDIAISAYGWERKVEQTEE